jgi:transposase
MDQRQQFIQDEQRGLYAMTELSARYGISPKTGYKWLARFAAGGRPGAWSLAADQRRATGISETPTQIAPQNRGWCSASCSG